MSRELDLLQGSWSITALEVDGRQISAGMFSHARMVIEGDRFTSTDMGAVYEGTIELDASTHPRQFDLKFDAGPEKGNTNPGIYEIDGDTWTFCLATKGRERPSTFASTPGTGFALERLTRRPAG